MCGFVHIYWLIRTSLNINKNEMSRADSRYRGETYQLCENQQQL